MGVVAGISHDKFPKQGSFLNSRVRVCFNYDADNVVLGTIVRDDAEDPGETIIALDDGRYVRATECMWSPDRAAAPKES